MLVFGTRYNRAPAGVSHISKKQKKKDMLILERQRFQTLISASVPPTKTPQP